MYVIFITHYFHSFKTLHWGYSNSAFLSSNKIVVLKNFLLIQQNRFLCFIGARILYFCKGSKIFSKLTKIAMGQQKNLVAQMSNFSYCSYNEKHNLINFMELFKSRGYRRLQNKVLLNLRKFSRKNTELS